MNNSRFFKEETAQGLTEYALILSLIALGVLIALSLFGDGVGSLFEDSWEKMKLVLGV